MKKQQAGMTLISWVIVLGIIAFLATFLMRLFPMYQEYYGVVQVMEGMEKEITANKLTKQQVRTLLSKRFNTGYIFSVKEDNIELERGKNNVHVDKIIIDYEVREPFIAHVSLVGSFHLEAEAQQAIK
jgi:Tfp pilus assembly major pilin PilA